MNSDIDVDITAGPAEEAGRCTVPVGPPGLSRREHEMLSFERQWWRRAGAKDTAIRDLFGVPPTRYYQSLNVLVDRTDALAADPVLVGRLRRLRTARHQRRTVGNPVHGAP